MSSSSLAYILFIHTSNLFYWIKLSESGWIPFVLCSFLHSIKRFSLNFILFLLMGVKKISSNSKEFFRTLIPRKVLSITRAILFVILILLIIQQLIFYKFSSIQPQPFIQDHLNNFDQIVESLKSPHDSLNNAEDASIHRKEFSLHTDPLQNSKSEKTIKNAASVYEKKNRKLLVTETTTSKDLKLSKMFIKTDGEYKKLESSRIGQMIKKLSNYLTLARNYLNLAHEFDDFAFVGELEEEIKKCLLILDSENFENSNVEIENISIKYIDERINAMERLINAASLRPYDTSTLISQLKQKLSTIEKETRKIDYQSKLYSQIASKSIPMNLHCLSMSLALRKPIKFSSHIKQLSDDEHSVISIRNDDQIVLNSHHDHHHHNDQNILNSHHHNDQNGLNWHHDNDQMNVISLYNDEKNEEFVSALTDNSLWHYALFSDNIIAVAVVVNSTSQNLKHPGKHVFHIVTDQMNYHGMKTWFMLFPPPGIIVEVTCLNDYTWINSSYVPVLKQIENENLRKYYFRSSITDIEMDESEDNNNFKYRNPKYLSILNHLRFYLPEIFPKLEKILFLDDDVVVQKDLSPLWDIEMHGNVNLAVETCGVTFHRFKTYLNFSNNLLSGFDPEGCAWAFGMNMFDLTAWRSGNYTQTYHYWQKQNENRMLWKLGTLPAGLLTFYNRTQPLDRTWQVLGLGSFNNIPEAVIDNAAVIHYNGHAKPWLELALLRYQKYWTKYVPYGEELLQACNILPP